MKSNQGEPMKITRVFMLAIVMVFSLFTASALADVLVNKLSITAAAQTESPQSDTVSIVGHVTGNDLKAVPRVTVILTDTDGNRRVTKTDIHGRYIFAAVESNRTYVIGAADSKNRYTTRVFNVVELHARDVKFTPEATEQTTKRTGFTGDNTFSRAPDLLE